MNETELENKLVLVMMEACRPTAKSFISEFILDMAEENAKLKGLLIAASDEINKLTAQRNNLVYLLEEGLK